MENYKVKSWEELCRAGEVDFEDGIRPPKRYSHIFPYEFKKYCGKIIRFGFDENGKLFDNIELAKYVEEWMVEKI